MNSNSNVAQKRRKTKNPSAGSTLSAKDKADIDKILHFDSSDSEEEAIFGVKIRSEKQELLDAAVVEWTMADENAMKMLGTDAFKKFFDTICKIQKGSNESLKIPDAGKIGEALDRRLAKITEQRRALHQEQCRIMEMKQNLKK